MSLKGSFIYEAAATFFFASVVIFGVNIFLTTLIKGFGQV